MTMITVPQTAEILGCCRQTVYNLISEGRIPAVRLRGHYRIHREKLEKQLAAEAAASISSASGVMEESTCLTRETIRPTGGSATSYQLASTLDDLLGQKTKRQPRP